MACSLEDLRYDSGDCVLDIWNMAGLEHFTLAMSLYMIAMPWFPLM